MRRWSPSASRHDPRGKPWIAALPRLRYRWPTFPLPLQLETRNEPNPQHPPAARRAGRIGSGAGTALDASCRATEIRHHRHRRRHRRVLRRRWCDLPPGQQGPRQARHPLLGRIDRRLGVQRQHHQVGRARPGLRAIRRAVQRLQGPRPVQGCRGMDRRARGVLGAPRALHRAGAQGGRRQDLHRLQGQALQRRQPGLGHPRVDGGTARAHELEAQRLLAGLGAEGRRTRPGAVRRQDRRLLLRGGPPVGQHPGPDHVLRRQAGAADRAARWTSWSRTSPTTPRR